MNDKDQNLGVKLTNELMTDIIGAIIPGALFIVCFAVSVVIPLVGIFTGWNFQFGDGAGAVSWALLILILLLSYVFGLIFYRADIKVPDKEDIGRQVIQSVIDLSRKDVKTVASLFYEDITVLKENITALENNGYFNETINKLGESCKEILRINEEYKEKNAPILECYDEGIVNLLNKNQLHINEVLFPEDFIGGGELKPESLEVLNSYIRLFTNAGKEYAHYNNHPTLILLYLFLDSRKLRQYIKDRKQANLLQRISRESGLDDGIFQDEDSKVKIDSSNAALLLLMYCCILHNQCDLGCCSQIRGEFPYLNCYKYLLKRNLKECVPHVDWTTKSSRTKNQLNEYKIQIQVFAPEAYALLNKNESHIRMSSASWHVAYRIRVISFAMIILVPLCVMIMEKVHALSPETTIAAVNNGIKGIGSCVCCRPHTIQAMVDTGLEYPELYAYILCPFIMFLLAGTIKRRIIKFIHYQRMREIYYTLHVYNEFKAIIDARKIKLTEKPSKIISLPQTRQYR